MLKYHLTLVYILGEIHLVNPIFDDKEFGGCAIFGVLDRGGRRFNGEMATQAISCMHERSNGLGGGFAAYGIYPEQANRYAFHVIYLNSDSRQQLETFLQENFEVANAEIIPTSKADVVDPPLLWRYFLDVAGHQDPGETEEDYVVRMVMKINSEFPAAYIASSGKNMGVFKGVGYPEEIAKFYRIDQYEGYCWLAHGRFPTNTTGWWGGAHPFNLLDWSVVHNGELSSYGINQRFLEMYDYKCTLRTDTEVVAYTVDLLMRRHGFSVQNLADVIAAPLWQEIDRMDEKQQRYYTALRQTYGSLLLNGPFSFVIGTHNQMIGLTDRIRLRPLVAGTDKDLFFVSTEEAAIRGVSNSSLLDIWYPSGGEPVVGQLATVEVV